MSELKDMYLIGVFTKIKDQNIGLIDWDAIAKQVKERERVELIQRSSEYIADTLVQKGVEMAKVIIVFLFLNDLQNIIL